MSIVDLVHWKRYIHVSLSLSAYYFNLFTQLVPILQNQDTESSNGEL